mgnify:CR=1 FL=1
MEERRKENEAGSSLVEELQEVLNKVKEHPPNNDDEFAREFLRALFAHFRSWATVQELTGSPHRPNLINFARGTRDDRKKKKEHGN